MGKINISAVMLAVGLSQFFYSCSTIRELLGFGFTQPKVTLRDIYIQSVAYDQVKLLVKLKVKNPNNFDIKMDKLNYQVLMGGAQIADGEYTKSISIGAETSNTVSLPLRIATKNALKILSDMIEEPEKVVVAVINATVLFDSPIGKIEHTFSDEKNFSGKDAIPGG